MNDNSFSYKDIKYDWNHQVFSQFDDKLILSFSTRGDKEGTENSVQSELIVDIIDLSGSKIKNFVIDEYERVSTPFISRSGEYFILPVEVGINTENHQREVIIYKISQNIVDQSLSLEGMRENQEQQKVIELEKYSSNKILLDSQYAYYQMKNQDK